ncbi:hypothetical protein HCQ94_05930 [Actinomyces sp. zg-332]|uniref:hypothetical protein n=1 Tax=Actinomyces sp. zg-332 TaxID=2708340 RepID=UPI00142410CF|nr:hypothetical protein [Actinomyces sp. zg-332]QPK94097.1 hypothetical protein HCQ94_05930 [Actinomyces sp. zg-332]
MLKITISILCLAVIYTKLTQLKKYPKSSRKILENIANQYEKILYKDLLKRVVKNTISTTNYKNHSAIFISELISRIESGEFLEKAWNETLKNFISNGFANNSEKIVSELHTICCFCSILGTNTVKILSDISKTIEKKEKLEINKQIAITPAKTTIKVLSFLPILAITLTLLLGVNPFEILLFSKSGNICLLLGVVFYVFGQIWTKKLLKNTIVDINTW